MENFNIKVLLLNIKNNISLIEKGFVSDSILDDIKKDFLNLLELIKLFLISKRDVYYGYFLMNMQFNVEFNKETIAGIKLNTYPPVFESNPLLLCKFNLNEIIYIICHEIEHIIFNHPAEMVKVNPLRIPDTYKRFNLAADASVNERLNYEIASCSYKFMSMPNGVVTSNSLANMFQLKKITPMESYKYYYELIKNEIIDENNQKQVLINKIGNDDFDKTYDENEYPKNANNSNNVEDHDWDISEEEMDSIEENTKEFINQSYNMINKENRGLLPSFFIEEVERINKPAIIQWQSILKKYIGTISAGFRKTKTRLNRRQPQRFDLSGKISDKTLKIVVAIDTSASISNQDVSYIFNEIFSIISKRKYDLTIIECDYEIQKIYKVRNQNDVQLDIKGRGGTEFSPVIKYINNNKYFRDALLIYFTDGYGELSIPKPLTYRNIWIILGNKNTLSLKEPYGSVLIMDIFEEE